MRNVILTVLLFCTLTVQAKNLYFSASTGDDSRDVLSAQNPNTPWRSLQKLNAIFSILQPGDTIFFKRGDVFDGSISFTKSGAPDHPLVFCAYGEGAKPVINGLRSLTGFTPYQGNIWMLPLAAAPPAVVLVDGRQQAMGRYPNPDEANRGYLNFESVNGTTSVTDNELTAAVNWTGAELVIRKNRWVLDRSLIILHDNNTLYYETSTTYVPQAGYGYFIQNHLKTLDKDGEWFFDKAQKILYLYKNDFVSSPTNVQATVVDTLLTIYKQNDITLKDLAFRGANETGLVVSYAKNVLLSGCEISYTGGNGIWMSYDTNLTIENTAFSNHNSNAITTTYGMANLFIRNNTISRTGALPGMGKTANLTYQGITIKGKNLVVEYNRIDSTGYVPIRFEGDSVIVRNNFISNFCFVKDDGGGIYTWNNDANAPENTYRFIKDNIILNGIGADAGTRVAGELHAHGIYFDDNVANVEITGNTVSGCAESGIYIHNARKLTIRNNTLYNNERQLNILRDNLSSLRPINYLDIRKNIFYAKNIAQQTMHWRSFGNDVMDFGASDSNYLGRPFNPAPYLYSTYRKNFTEFLQAYDLSTWRGALQKDSNSRFTFVSQPPYTNNGLVGANKVLNATFEKDIYQVYGYFYAGSYTLVQDKTGKLDGGSLQVTFDTTKNNRGWIMMDVGSLAAGKAYILRFSLLGTSNNKSIGLFLRQTTSPYTRMTDYQFCKVLNSRTENEFLFIPPVDMPAATLVFDISDQGTVWLDNIQLYEASVTVPNPDEFLLFDYNPSNEKKTVPLAGNYVDARDSVFTGSVILEPYNSVVLLKFTEKGSQAISFDSIPDKIYGDSSFVLKATATSNLPVAFRVVSGPGTIASNQLTLTGAGTVTIEALQSGNALYNAATPVQRRFSVAKAGQLIRFPDIGNKTFGDAPFALAATASSGLPVSYRVTSGPATVSGNTVTVTGAGLVLIDASQAGDNNYEPAPFVSQSFTVNKATQTIAFPPIADKIDGDPSFALNASASSGLPVSYRVVSGPATVSGNTVTLTGTGTVLIEASQSGDANYAEAAAVSQSFGVAPAKQNQTITFAAIPNKTYGDPSFALAATASSGLPVSFRVVSGPATVAGNVVAITGAGTVSIEAAQAGNAAYNAATSVVRSFAVAKANQTIAFGTLPNKTYGDPPFALTATASSGLAVSYRVVSGPAVVSGAMLTITGAGTVSVEASQAGSANYNAAAPVSRSFTVSKAAQTITFPAIPNKTYGDPPFALTATASSGLPVVYKVVSGPATVAGNIVTLTGTGTVNIEASQAGNENYKAAASVKRQFSVAKKKTAAAAIRNGEPDLRLTGERSYGDLQLIVVPNPVRSQGLILVRVDETTNATISLYNSEGKRVKQVEQRVFKKGVLTSLPLAAETLPAGTYFVRIATEKTSLVQMFQVIR